MSDNDRGPAQLVRRIVDGNSGQHPLADLGLSGRAHNALLRHGVATIEQLAQLSEDELWAIRNLGLKTIAEIQAAMASWESSSQVPPPVETAAKPPCVWEAWGLSSWLIEDYAPLSLLGLARRTHGALARAGFLTVRQVALLELCQLERLWQIGDLAIENIRDCLTAHSTVPGGRPLRPGPEAVEPKHSFADVVKNWLELLTPRNRVIITRRLGLDGESPDTLEAIGRALGITRERVRQIETKSLARLLRMERGKPLISYQQGLREFLAHKDGVASTEEIRYELGLYVDLGGFDPLLCCQLLAGCHDTLCWIQGLGLLCDENITQATILRVRRELRRLVPNGASSLVLSQLPLASAASSSFQEYCGNLSDAFLMACLRTDPAVTIKDGVASWSGQYPRSVQPLVKALEALGAPAHYSEITAKANEDLISDDQVSERNVHATLNRCTDIFVRVGAGTYALAEWDGPTDAELTAVIADILNATSRPLTANEIMAQLQPTDGTDKGAVLAALATDGQFKRLGHRRYGLAGWSGVTVERLSDIAERVLAEARKPLSLSEITNRVLAVRSVSRNSVYPVISKDPRFTRVGPGRYGLVAWAGDARYAIVDWVVALLEEAGVALTLRQIGLCLPGIETLATAVALATDERVVQSKDGHYALAAWDGSPPDTAGQAVYALLAAVGAPLSVGEISDALVPPQSVAESTLRMLLSNDRRFSTFGEGKFGLADRGMSAYVAGIKQLPLVEEGSTTITGKEQLSRERTWNSIAEAAYQVLALANCPLSVREILSLSRSLLPSDYQDLKDVLRVDPRFAAASTGTYGLADAFKSTTLF